MSMTRRSLCVLFSCVLAADAADDTASQPDTTEMSAAPASSVNAVFDSGAADTAAERTGRNPWIAAGLSSLLPGAGQVYTRRYVKGVLYAGVDIGLALYGHNRYQAGEEYTPEIKRLNERFHHLLDSAGTATDTSAYLYRYEEVLDTSYDTSGVMRVDTVQSVVDSVLSPTVYRMALDTARFKRDRFRYSAYQSWWWAASCYVYGILDAVEKTGVLDNDEPRKPAVAGWLSAVPFLGLGQFYNGRSSKAGMIFMVQTSLAYMALNNHRLLMRAQDNLRCLGDASKPEYAVARDLAGSDFVHEWKALYNQAFRNRNAYLWYSIFFYFYNVFDAVVDAHLHDYRRRMRLEPDLRVRAGFAGMRLSVTY